jgi:hypothetical protein
MRGIYIWAFRFREQHWVYYLGETGKSFLQRHLEHITLYYEGYYRIYDAAALARGERKVVWEWAMGPSNQPRRAKFRRHFRRVR